MKPIDHAIKEYGDKLPSLIDEFMAREYYVYSGPDFFVLAYPHVKDLLLGLNLNKTLDDIDTWVIHFFAGDIKRLFEIAPFRLKWVAFERYGQSRYRFYNAEKLNRRLSYVRRITESTPAPVATTDSNQPRCCSGK